MKRLYCAKPLDIPESRARLLLACPILVCPWCLNIVIVGIVQLKKKV